MFDDKIKDHTAMHGVSFFSQYFPTNILKLRISKKRFERSDVINETVLLAPCLLIDASLFIICSCKKMATQ